MKIFSLFTFILIVVLGSVASVVVVPPLMLQADKETKPLTDKQVIAQITKLAAIFQLIRENSIEPIDEQKLLEAGMNGMLTSLDPHSGYLNKKDFKGMVDMTSGAFGGLGIQINKKDDLIQVIAPIDGTPAQRAGLQSGDYISHIDGKSVEGESLDKCISRMKGRPGTKVELTVLKRGAASPRKIVLTRALIEVKSVKWRYENGIEIIRIANFDDETQTLLERAMREAAKKKARILLDLRDNPGGTLDSAISTSQSFLKKGDQIVTIHGRDKSLDEHVLSKVDGLLSTPIVILINGGTASAAEILSGALQSNGRGVVLGTKSFGKGSVQSVRGFSDGSGVKLTTARYYLPNGRSIQGRGIVPNVVLLPPEAVCIDDFTDTFFAESDYRNALSNDTKVDNKADKDYATEFRKQKKALKGKTTPDEKTKLCEADRDRETPPKFDDVTGRRTDRVDTQLIEAEHFLNDIKMTP